MSKITPVPLVGTVRIKADSVKIAEDIMTMVKRIKFDNNRTVNLKSGMHYNYKGKLVAIYDKEEKVLILPI